MNKTLSIILIVIASLVVLGGTYWYFGVQKPKPQMEATPSMTVESAKAQPTVAKASLGVKAEPPLPQKSPAPDQGPEKPEEESIDEQKEAPAVERPKQKKQMPSLTSFTTKGGIFALPSAEDKSEEAVEGEKKSTSVLISETLPAKEEVTTSAIMEEKKGAGEKEEQEIEAEKEPQPPIVDPVMPDQAPSPVPLDVQDDPQLADMQGDVADEVILIPGSGEPLEAPSAPIEVVETSPPEKTPAVIKTLKSETVGKDEKTAGDKPAIEASLSVSFLDYAFLRDFSTSEKSFTVSMDVMSQKEMFGWGGTLEVGRMEKSGVVQISLLGKATWKLGRGTVTYPLSISLGPTLFIDSTADTTEFGMKGKLSAGVTYAISDSFRIFYAVGVGATYNFPGSPSFHFVMEPIRVGVGFSF